MNSLSIRRFLIPFAIGLAALLAACGSGHSEDPTPTTAAAANTPAAAASITAPTSFPGGPSTSFTLTGGVDTPAKYDLAALKAVAKNTVSTNPQAGSGMLGEHSYSGPLLIDLLNAAGLKQDANLKNDLLRRSVVVTGSDGYKSVIAWGEIDPRFADKQVLIAYERDGQALPTEDGFARLIVPGDVFAGRYISNVVSIELKDTIPAPAAGARGATTQFDVSGAVNTPGTITLDRLKSMPQTTVTVPGSNGASTVYTGVLLTDFFTAAGGLKLDSAKKNDQLTKSVVGIGSDGYASVVAYGEADAKFGNKQILIAITRDGAPLSDADGFARLVVPGDNANGRYVSNLKTLQVVGF